MCRQWGLFDLQLSTALRCFLCGSAVSQVLCVCVCVFPEFTLLKTGRLIYVLSLEMRGINYKNSRGDVFHILTGDRSVHKRMTDESSRGQPPFSTFLFVRFSTQTSLQAGKWTVTQWNLNSNFLTDFIFIWNIVLTTFPGFIILNELKGCHTGFKSGIQQDCLLL